MMARWLESDGIADLMAEAALDDLDVDERLPHNHDEGDWRADCPNCGLRS